ncbi:MAG: sigma-70 family RNA polymerase sigma factor [Actinomycetales bacterium]|nr:sigma-70 family RNA polymerase sigma factor [Actinomycetales bacterium]
MARDQGIAPRDESFDSVLAAARVGAPWACTAIWQEYSSAVMAFLASRGSREPDDLTSEVFLAVFDRIPRFEGGEPQLRSFIFSIAYRRLVDELRARSRRDEPTAWTPELDPRAVDSAERDAERRLGDERARQLLDELVPDQRDVMVLRIVADLTVEQVAEVLGKNVGAVKALQRRALENLRKKVAPTRTPA